MTGQQTVNQVPVQYTPQGTLNVKGELVHPEWHRCCGESKDVRLRFLTIFVGSKFLSGPLS